MKIVFIGDSITDAGRDKENYYDMGNGYPKFAAEGIKAAHPDKDLVFINKGVSGTRTGQLFDRLYVDAIKHDPDIVSILIGINDIWHRYSSDRQIKTTDAQIELNYRCILERLKKETNAKIVMMAPFLLDASPKEEIREDIKTVLPIVRKLADEFADVFIPLDKHFEEALKTQPEPLYYSKDGVHPNDNGRAFIGKLFAEAVEPLINSL